MPCPSTHTQPKALNGHTHSLSSSAVRKYARVGRGFKIHRSSGKAWSTGSPLEPAGTNISLDLIPTNQRPAVQAFVWTILSWLFFNCAKSDLNHRSSMT